MMRLFRRSAAVASVLLLAAAVVQAQQSSRADCDAAHPASRGRAGKDVVRPARAIASRSVGPWASASSSTIERLS
jgi:hypothetical protein